MIKLLSFYLSRLFSMLSARATSKVRTISKTTTTHQQTTAIRMTGEKIGNVKTESYTVHLKRALKLCVLSFASSNMRPLLLTCTEWDRLLLRTLLNLLDRRSLCNNRLLRSFRLIKKKSKTIECRFTQLL